MRSETVTDSYELSPVQQGILFHCLCAEHAGVYVSQMVIDLPESLNRSAFEHAWQGVVERHTVLRTSFQWGERSEPIQRVHGDVQVPSETFDWRAFSAEEQATATDSYLRSDRRRGFDLRKAPLMRLAVFQLGEAAFRVVWTFHHILIDGRSYPTILKQVFALHDAFCRGQTLELDKPRPFRDYVEWIRQLDLSGAESFWKQRLKGFSAPTPLLRDREDASMAAEEDLCGARSRQFSERLSLALRSLALRENLTLATLIHGAWALLLSRYSGEEDIVFGATRTTRRGTIEGAESMVGLFVNTVPIRARVSPAIPVRPWLEQLQSEWVSLRSFDHVPLVKIKEWSEIRGASQLFDSVVMFENRRFDVRLRAEDSRWRNRVCRLRQRTNYALTLIAYGDPEVQLTILYDRRSFEDSTVTRMLGHLETLLEEMAADPMQPVSTLPLLTEAERHQLLVEWNNTRTDYPEDSCLHELVEAQVEQSPESVALVCEERKLSYREMNARANQLAHHLRALGVGPDVPVGICMERSPEMILGLLGILKAGGAYVPLDPTYPEERLAFMLEDSRVPVLLTQRRLLETLPQRRARLLCLDPDWWANAEESRENPSHGAGPENLAYVIYTSGTTGRPKGVQVEHRGLCNLVWTQARTCGVRPGDRVLQFCSLSFDPSIFEIGVALSSGATLCLGSQDSLMPGPALFRLLRNQAITTIILPPSVLSPLPDEPLPALHTIIVGAEPVTAEFVKRWGGQRRVLNIYGTTETTVFSTIAQCAPDGRKPPVGRPVANTQVYLLDAHLRPVPLGVPGELYIGGVGLARGYLNRPELTAEKFIPNPFLADPEARLYKTGDLARYLPDGNIDFLGRVDYQVKVRGYRIELEEIEAVLAEHPAVRESVVVARDNPGGDKRLVAYYVPAKQGMVSARELRSYLKQKLPEYMVPAVFVSMEILPRSPNGKVDRNALPVPPPTHPEMEEASAAPHTRVECLIAGVWQEVLGVDRVALDDNFFDLGGHSLVVMKVIARLEKELGVRINPGEFPLQTLGQIASVYEERMRVARHSEPTGFVQRLLRKVRFAALPRALDGK